MALRDDELARVDRNFAQRLGRGIRTKAVPFLAQGAENMYNAATFLPRQTLGFGSDVVQGFRSAGSTQQPDVQVPPQMGAPNTNRQVGPQPIIENYPGYIQAGDRTITMADIEKGYSRPGGVGLKGNGSYSMVDMSQVPNKAPADMNAGFRQPSTQITPMTPMEVYTDHPGGQYGGGVVRMRPRGSAPAVQEREVPSLGGTFGETVMAGLRTRQDRTYANIDNAARQTDLTARGQDITTRGQDLDFQSQGMRNAIDAQRYADLAPGALAQGQLFQSQAEKAQMESSLLQQYQVEEDPVRKKQILDTYNSITGNVQQPKIHFGEMESITEGGIEKTPYASTFDQQGGFRVMTPGNSSIVPAQQQVQERMMAMPEADRERLRAQFGNRTDVTPEEILQAIEAMRK